MQKYRDILNPAVRLVIETGYEILPGGTELVGRAEHLGSEAKYHVLWAPLSDEEINHLESQIGRIHPEFIRFLHETNGLSLFAGRLSIYGKRWRSDRMGMGRWLPFDIVTANTDERPIGLSADKMIVGSVGQESDYLIMDVNSGIVEHIDRETCDSIRSWGSLHEMLEFEVERLVDVYRRSSGFFPPEPSWITDLPRIERRTKIVEAILDRYDIMEFRKYGDDFDYSHEALRIGAILENGNVSDLKEELIKIFKEDFEEDIDEKSEKWLPMVNELRLVHLDRLE